MKIFNVNKDSNTPSMVFQVGDKVQKGQVICIIEAMKLMNEIEVCSYSLFLTKFSAPLEHSEILLGH